MALNDNTDSLLDDILKEHEDKKSALPDENSSEGTVSENEAAAEIIEETVPENNETDENDTADHPDADAEEADSVEEYDDEEEEEVPAAKPKKKRRKRFSTKLAVGLLLTTIIIVVSILLAVYALKTAKELIGHGKQDMEIVVEIPENAGTADIADILVNNGVIDDAMLFRVVSKIKGTDGFYVAGSHKVNPSMSYGDIIKKLQEDAINEREVADVTFPEGITLVDAAKRLEEKGVCSADEFIDAFNSASFGYDFEADIKKSSLKFYKMEGYLFPDTYRFYLDEDPLIVSKKIYKNFNDKMTRDLLGRMKDMGKTLEETLTLASIVQAEAGDTANMKRVASVFYNRLNNSDDFPLLQSDPTSAYVRDVIVPNSDYVTDNMKTAYDTYKGAGLPPGPICNPGLDAIKAVLYPAETDYFYFCSNLETGEFYYAKTLEEHEANLVKAGLA